MKLLAMRSAALTGKKAVGVLRWPRARSQALAAWKHLMCCAIHPHVLVQELFVKVAAHCVVDKSLFLLGRRPGLILENRVIIPTPLQREISSMNQRIALHDLITPGTLI